MAGRSGGFPFGPWQQILQMQVQGRVMPETLEIDGSESAFEGLATIRIVGEAGGQIVSATVRDVRFVSRQGAGGAGEAWHLLELPELQLTIGPAPMKSGHIAVWN